MGAFVDSGPRETLDSDAIAIDAVFGDAIGLNAWRFSDGRALDLEWELRREIGGDLRVFAIVLAEPYQPNKPFDVIAQADGTPAARLDYLKTGERFVTRHAFNLAADEAGEYSVYIGWYNPRLGTRLSAPYPASMLALPAVHFAPPAQ